MCLIKIFDILMKFNVCVYFVVLFYFYIVFLDMVWVKIKNLIYILLEILFCYDINSVINWC